MTSSSTPGKTRLIAIDALKALAVLLIFNHRMYYSYADYTMFATGGAMGCALFFFVSGYTLNLSSCTTFKSWLQKRIGRLFLPIMAISFLQHYSAYHSFIDPGIWFVQCIMIYYIVFYFIKKHCSRCMISIAVCTACVYGCIFFLFYPDMVNLYGFGRSKWVLFFLFFMSGAIWQERHADFSAKWRTAMIPVALILIFSELLLRFSVLRSILPPAAVLLSPILLLCGIIALFTACELMDKAVKKPLAVRLLAPVMAAVAALSLESYIGIGPICVPLQHYLAPLFPFNIPMVMIGLLIFSYGLRVSVRFIDALISSTPEKLSLRYILAPY